MKLPINELIIISSTDPDDARRRKLLNILLLGIAFTVSVVFVITLTIIVTDPGRIEEAEGTGPIQILYGSVLLLIGMFFRPYRK